MAHMMIWIEVRCLTMKRTGSNIGGGLVDGLSRYEKDSDLKIRRVFPGTGSYPYKREVMVLLQKQKPIH